LLDDFNYRADNIKIRYSSNHKNKKVECFQVYLNTVLRNNHLVIDGYAGKKTSDAMYSVFGSYLLGDPRIGGRK